MVSGLSGSGKTTAIHALEDAGHFCVDNLPGPLLETFLRLVDDNPAISRVAIAMDVREASFYPDVARRLAEIQAAGYRAQILYLDCNDRVAINRFKETRRRHPLLGSGDAKSLDEAIQMERAWLEPIRSLASTVIDTSGANIHELKRRVQALYGGPSAHRMNVHLMSFGFRHGLPAEADFVFDVRFIPNPYFVEHLRPGSGLDGEVSAYVLAQPAAGRMLDHILNLLSDVLPLAEEEGKPSTTVAIGCTGGRHRSVAMVEALRGRVAATGRDPLVTHRDIQK